MKAAFIERVGPPDVIQYGDLPDPQPGAGQVLVKVRACAVNPIDTYVRAGTVAMPLTYPFIVGCDLAGEVVAVGPGVRTLAVGDRVWGSNQGVLGRLPVSENRFGSPLYGIITGVTATTDTGSPAEATMGPCDDPPVAGLLKLCTQTVYFGRQSRQTRTLANCASLALKTRSSWPAEPAVPLPVSRLRRASKPLAALRVTVMGAPVWL